MSRIRTRAIWLVPFEIAFALATVAVIAETSFWRSTYSGASVPSAIVDLAAGIGLLAAGTALVVGGVRPVAGRIALFAGVAWLCADWVGWQDGLAAARTLAMAAALLYLPLVLHLLTVQQRPQRHRIMRRFVLSGYALAVAIALALLLFRDPRVDLYCWSNCADDVVLIGNVPLVVSLLRVVAPAFEVAAGMGIILVGAVALAGGTPAQRRAAAFVAIPAALVGATGATHGLALLADPHEGPRFALHVALFQLRAASAALLAAGLAWTVVRAWRSRLAVERLATDLGSAPQPGGVESALAAATGDPSLELLYWLQHPDRFVDASGRLREVPADDARRAVTRVTHAGRLIGVAVHDRELADAAELDRLLGPASRLGLENERLRAELLAKVEEVRASRRRIVATGDAARARLERDLHDGAQQGLLGVVFELRAAVQAAETAGETETLLELNAALDEAEATVAELREIAHGIYPAVLADRGLGAALRTLADTAALPVVIEDLPSERLPETAERAGYAVVASAVDAAVSAGADELTVRGIRAEDRLILELQGLGSEQAPEIADRASAADGGWSREGPILRVWIPCA